MKHEVLTERERRAAMLIARGFRNTDVAGELGVSLRTIESDRARLMRKLGFSRRTELVRWALERGLVVRRTRDAVAGNPQHGSAPPTMEEAHPARRLPARQQSVEPAKTGRP